MDLDELAKHWDTFGRDDPLWAVLTSTEKRYGGWDAEEFRRTGEEQVSTSLRFLEAQGVTVPAGRALDFGCGPGRLTQALCTHFESVDGVDIAASMIGLAREWNQHGDRCRYHVNERSDLSIFDDNSFDFVFTILVLQHMEAKFQLGYIAEFARCLAPGGMAFFQVMTEKKVLAEPLPDDAFRADIEFQAPVAPVTTGAVVDVPVTVKNTGSTEWPTMSQGGWYMVTLANRWLDEEGNVVVADDARSFLPRDLPPGEDASMVLAVTAPPEPGRYQLQIDLVQEGVTWFQDKGSTPAHALVEVVAGALAATHEDFHARMEMHVVSVEQCQRALESQECRIKTYPYGDVFGEADPHFESLFILAEKAEPRARGYWADARADADGDR